MKFSIITPSFRNSDWLKLCIASVADQNVELEHIIQDAGSDDGTLDWLPHDKRVRAFVEKDAGMYDGINRGLRKATGDILAYLNCDEQYLPGGLKAVEDYFLQHPEIDIVVSDSVVVDPRGNYVCSRQVLIPQKYHTWVVHLSVLTCAIFFRRRVLEQHQLFFDPSFKYVGDSHWVLRALDKGLRLGVLRYFTSVFTETGINISLHEGFRKEKTAFYNRAPGWVLKLRPLWIIHHRLRRLLGGVYFQKPFQYALYTQRNPAARTVHDVPDPTFRWKPWHSCTASS